MQTIADNTIPLKPKRNNRRSPRTKINMHVKVWRRIKGEKKLVPGYSRNISQDGIAVFIPAQIALDENVELQFRLPGFSTEVTVHAVVRGVNKFQYGMEFTSLDGAVKRLLAAAAVA
ncbi:MAG TPA: PilZ domain-containing protein [Candidatus Angelobacter sp.]|nr:PilZ domain-containing protein [Candidatus Angelobacter sp.]